VTKGSTQFREFVAMINEDLKMQAGTGGQSTMAAINYKTEPTFYRFGNTGSDKFSANGNDECSVSNRLVGGAQPQTPIFTAKAGTPVRFRMLHPPGTGIVQVMAINGHNWQATPYVNNSTQLGNNKLSNTLGSQDNVGATAHYDVLIDQAGGPFKVAGDYFYSAFVPAKSEFGMWGVFRVLDQNGNMVIGNNASPSCAKPTTQPALIPKRGVDRLDTFRLKPATKEGANQ
jgi:manganese oxidase